jgi:hypothetical protein
MHSYIWKSHKIKIETYKLHTKKLNDSKILSIRNKLINVDWNYLNDLDVDNALNEFENKLIGVIDSIAPEKVKIINNKNIIQEPWMTLGYSLLQKSKTNYSENVWARIKTVLNIKIIKDTEIN